MRSETRRAIERRAFQQGFVCACAVIARDALRNAGKINWAQIDECDKAILRKVKLCP
jgi:hypothetical protein